MHCRICSSFGLSLLESKRLFIVTMSTIRTDFNNLLKYDRHLGSIASPTDGHIIERYSSYSPPYSNSEFIPHPTKFAKYPRNSRMYIPVPSIHSARYSGSYSSQQGSRVYAQPRPHLPSRTRNYEDRRVIDTEPKPVPRSCIEAAMIIAFVSCCWCNTGLGAIAFCLAGKVVSVVYVQCIRNKAFVIFFHVRSTLSFNYLVIVSRRHYMSRWIT